MQGELTDELLLLYLDTAGDRLEREGLARFEQAVEAARMGTVFAHNLKAYRRWHSAVQRRRPGRPAVLSDAALEQAIMRIGDLFPGAVSRVTA